MKTSTMSIARGDDSCDHRRQLIVTGQIDVAAPVSRYLPEFTGQHLDSITVRHLLQHSSGLVQWQPLYYHASHSAETYGVIREMPLGWGVGEARHYSDLGFMLLGYIVERVTTVDRLSRESVSPARSQFDRVNPRRARFNNSPQPSRPRLGSLVYAPPSAIGQGGPTEWNRWRSTLLNGRSTTEKRYYANGGVAGHAGLFSTAADLSVLLDLLNKRGVRGGRKYIRPRTVDLFLTRDKYENYLGWQAPRDLPSGSFSHTGFTGTYVLGVPTYKLSIVLLTNRQNIGTDARGYFPDIGPLQRAVSKVIVDGSATSQAGH